MDQQTTTTDLSGNQAVPTANGFPVLALGTRANGRYEVSQVISESEREHAYQVIDRQSYRRCWNCQSEQNAEGDAFCSHCGADLLDAEYILHEYPVQALSEDAAQALSGAVVDTFVEQGRAYQVEQPQVEQPAFATGVHVTAASASDAGNVRRAEPNEDSTLILQFQRIHESVASPAGAFVVADGMGGHANGQEASRMAIRAIADALVREVLAAPLAAEKAATAGPALGAEGMAALAQAVIGEANMAICEVNAREKSDMGSTVTGFVLVGDLACIFNVGDSRTYLLREGKLYQLTTDHSLVNQLVAGGLITPEEVYDHPQRNQIFRSLGEKGKLLVDTFLQQVRPGDVVLSCCDGLWEMVRNPQITAILAGAPDPQAACAQLIEAANANGGEDNISAVVVFVRA